MRSTLTIAVLLLCCTQVQAQDAMQQRIEVLERKVRVISELVIRLDRLQREVQQLRGEVEVQNHALESMKQRQRDLYLDLDSRLSQSSGSGAPQGSPPTGSGNAQPPGGASVSMPGSSVTEVEPRKGTPSKASPEEERAYRKAFEMLTQRRYDEARKSFRKFVAKYPNGAYSDNAQYWLAEASYVTREFDTALKDFSRVLEVYPNSSKVPGAMLKIGYIQYENKQLPKARETLQKLIRKYPASSAARLAEEFMRRKEF